MTDYTNRILARRSLLLCVWFASSAWAQTSLVRGALDASQTYVHSAVDKERIEELPVQSRKYLNFALLVGYIAPRRECGLKHYTGTILSGSQIHRNSHAQRFSL